MPKQFVIQVANKPGEMARLAEQLAARNVDLRAIGGGGLGERRHRTRLVRQLDDELVGHRILRENWMR